MTGTRRRILWAGAILALLLPLGGCALNQQLGLVKDKLKESQAAQTQAKQDPQAELVKEDLAAAAEHQAAAERLLKRWETYPLLDPTGEAAKEISQAQAEADKSLAAAKAALEKLRRPETLQPQAAEAGAPEEAGPPPLGRPEEEAALAKAAAAPEKPLTLPEEPLALYQYGLAKYKAGDFIAARQAFVAFLGRHPRHDLAVNAQYWVGETYYSQEEWVMALGAFKAVLAHYPNGRKAPDALFKLALTEMNLGRQGEAKKALEELKRRFPNSEAAKLAKQRFGPK